jgi:hypothetical protein
MFQLLRAKALCSLVKPHNALMLIINKRIMNDKRYFKFRGSFQIFAHRYDIGLLFFGDRRLEGNFFVLKIYEIGESEYKQFYDYQLGFYLKEIPDDEEVFFNYVHDIITNRIKHFKRHDPFSKKYASGLVYTRKLEAFLDFLKTVDQWHKTQPIESVISDKDTLIDQLQRRIKELERQLKEATKYDAGEKVVIDKGGMPVFIDLVKQIQNLTLPNDNKLTRSQTQSSWYKMIAKYFQHGENNIPIGTAQNYFPSQKDTDSTKYLIIDEKDKLFKIVPTPQKK